MTDNSKSLKNKVIVILLVVIAIMVTAIIVLAYDNDHFIKPGEHGGSDARWKVEFTSIAEGEKTGNAESRYLPYYTSTYASFYVDFVAPGDSMTYDVQISNLGTLDAKLSSILYISSPFKDAIKYEVEGLNLGDVIEAGQVVNFKIKVSYELDSTVAIEFDKPITLSFVFTQSY